MTSTRTDGVNLVQAGRLLRELMTAGDGNGDGEKVVTRPGSPLVTRVEALRGVADEGHNKRVEASDNQRTVEYGNGEVTAALETLGGYAAGQIKRGVTPEQGKTIVDTAIIGAVATESARLDKEQGGRVEAAITTAVGLLADNVRTNTFEGSVPSDLSQRVLANIIARSTEASAVVTTLLEDKDVADVHGRNQDALKLLVVSGVVEKLKPTPPSLPAEVQ